MLGLGSTIAKSARSVPTIVRDGLVLKHGYAGGPVQPVSTGAADINADGANNDYIDVGAIPITTNDITVSAWVYTTTWVDYAPIFSNRSDVSSNPGIELRHDSGAQKYEVIIDDGVSSAVITAGSLKNTNQWYHVCGVWDRDGSQYLYVDGVLDITPGDISGRAGTLNHSTTARIGTAMDGSPDMRGYVCNVGYWNAALTQAQVKSIMHKDYASLSDSEKTSLVSWWNLDSTITDTTVFDNHHGGGSELASNCLTGSWVGTGGWSTITGGVSNTTGENGNTRQSSIEFTDFIGSVYKLTYTVSNTTDDTDLKAKFGGGANQDIPGVNGTHSVYLVSDAGYDNFQFVSTTAWAGEVTDISLQLVNGNTGTLS